MSIQARLTLEDAQHRILRRDVGPINLQFTVPMLCVSRLQVRYLQACPPPFSTPTPPPPGFPLRSAREIKYVTTRHWYHRYSFTNLSCEM